jgi:uncharacterized glyoxalase superfamily protein PhnB
MKAQKFLRCNPHLPVKNLQNTLDFYRNTLGFEEEWTWANKEGKITDGGIRRNGMRLLFGEDPEFTLQINNKKHQLSIMWFVDNIEEIFVEFQKRDIEIAASLQTHSYGLKEFAFIDINGYYIRVAESTDSEWI